LLALWTSLPSSAARAFSRGGVSARLISLAGVFGASLVSCRFLPSRCARVFRARAVSRTPSWAAAQVLRYFRLRDSTSSSFSYVCLFLWMGLRPFSLGSMPGAFPRSTSLVCVPCPVPSPGIVCDSLFWWLVVQSGGVCVVRYYLFCRSEPQYATRCVFPEDF